MSDTHERTRRLAEWLSTWLEPDERDVVLGDLDEMRTPPRRAVLEIAELIVRRRFLPAVQLLALSVSVLTTAVILAYASKFWAMGDVTRFAGLWAARPAAFADATIWAGSPTGTASVVGWVLLNVMTLAAWSCAGGYVLAALSRTALWPLTIAAYAVTVTATIFGGTVAAAPTVPDSAVAAAVAIHCAFGVLLPALLGIRLAPAAGRPPRLVLGAAALLGLALTWRAAPHLEVAFVSMALGFRPTGTWRAALVAMAVAWPLVVAAARPARRHLDIAG